ncbi:exodeoxyribonuclease I, partial [Aliivibrio fischeri]|uniref:exodeoxyribonuclease I n=2 Tax=Aliivibrio TaxID=511678 RepID=UPI001EEEC346
RGNISWIVPVAWHPTNNNAVITIDLALDPSVFLELNVEELHQRMYTKRSELGPDELPVPVKLVHLNKCPVLAPAKTLTAENAANLNVDREACLRNLKVIRENPEIRQKLIELYSIEPNYEKSTNVDTLLYDGFFSHADKATIDIIRQSTPEQLIDFEPNVTDPRIKPLLFRYRARNFPHTLNEAEQLRWHAHLQDYFQTHLPDYEASFESLYLESEGNDKKVAILKAVYNYVQQLIS